MLVSFRKRLRREEKGFTLIELLVVVIILAILTAIAIPSYLSFTDRANRSAAKADVRSIIPSVESYYADNGTYAGMSVAGLKAAYDQSLNASVYSVIRHRARRTYCVDAKAIRRAPRSVQGRPGGIAVGDHLPVGLVASLERRRGAGNRALFVGCGGASSPRDPPFRGSRTSATDR